MHKLLSLLGFCVVCVIIATAITSVMIDNNDSSTLAISYDENHSHFNVPNVNGTRHPTSEEVANFTRFIGYAAASYCPYNENLVNWDCGVDCDLTPGTSFVAGIHGSDDVSIMLSSVAKKIGEDTFAIIAVNNLEEIVISFRGTNNINNIIKDFDFEPMSYVLPSGLVSENAHVHSGFHIVWSHLRDGINKELSNLVMQYPTYSIAITGHSMGGALALLHALDVRYNFPDKEIKLFQFNSPRVGDQFFAQYANSTLDFIKRTVLLGDPVSHLPFDNMGFMNNLVEHHWEHAKGEVWIADPSLQEEGTFECQGNENPACSDSLNIFEMNIFDHEGPFYWNITTSFPCKTS